MLYKTLAPKILSNSIIFNTSLDDIKKYTSYCDYVSDFETEISINLLWDKAKRDPHPIRGYREYAKSVILNGPDLSSPFLVEFTERLDRIPSKNIKKQIVNEINQAFEKANYVANTGRKYTSLSNDGYIFNDNDFINALGNLLLKCNPPCNYFSPISDGLSILGTVQEMPGPTVAPLWDTVSQVIHTPINVANVTFNKISNVVQETVVGLSNAVESIFRDGLIMYFDDDRINEETGLLEAGQSLASLPHGYSLVADTDSYFKTGEAVTQILTDTRVTIGDCFRLYEYYRRYNPYDKDHNHQKAHDGYVVIDVEGQPTVVDWNGKKKVPVPHNRTIDGVLGTRNEEYDWDDPCLRSKRNQEPIEGFPPEAQPTPDDIEESQGLFTGGEKEEHLARNKSNYSDGNNDTKITVYSWDLVDPYARNDSPTRKMIGNRNNLLRENSLALSAGIRDQLGVKPGDRVYVTDNQGREMFLGYYDDTSPSAGKNIDIYIQNPAEYSNRSFNISSSNISVKPGNGTIPWSESKARAIYDRYGVDYDKRNP